VFMVHHSNNRAREFANQHSFLANQQKCTFRVV